MNKTFSSAQPHTLILSRRTPLSWKRLQNRSTGRNRQTVKAEQDLLQPAKPPSGVTLPPVSPETPPPNFGFVENAERLNSRAAMIGFFALIALEFILGRGLLETVGFRVGNGLPFEI